MVLMTDQSGPWARKTVLPSGLRVLTERLEHVDSVSLGLWIAAGTRHEPAGQEGITHFLEHMLFKGTESRSALQIAQAIDDIGGQVNGLTDRELVCLHARTVGERAAQALELLFDLLLRPVCAEQDVAREREVVLQEIGHVEDAPEDWVHELVVETAWAGHPLARPLSGTPESVRGIDRVALLAHLSELRAADRLLVAAAGRVEHDEVVSLADRLGAELKRGRPREDEEPPRFLAESRFLCRPTAQVHLCLARPGCARTDDGRHIFALLDTILGGGTSSRLFQEIRENQGLTYGIGSYLQCYGGAGLFVIDAGVAPGNFRLVLDLIEKELDKLREQGPQPEELARAKTQLQVALSLAAESTAFRMQHLAISELYWRRVLSFAEIAAGLERVTAEDVHQLARRAFGEEREALVAIGPFSDAGGER